MKRRVFMRLPTYCADKRRDIRSGSHMRQEKVSADRAVVDVGSNCISAA